MVLGGAEIALLIVCPFLAYFLVKWLWEKDTVKENRRKRAIEVSAIYKRRAAEDLPKLLNDYGVGDYSGLVKAFFDLLHKFVGGDDAAIEREIDRVLDNMNKVVAQTAEGRARLTAIVAAGAGPAPVVAS